MFWFRSATACVHAVWKQDQYFLWPPLSLLVPSHGALMAFFFFFNICIYFDCYPMNCLGIYLWLQVTQMIYSLLVSRV